MIHQYYWAKAVAVVLLAGGFAVHTARAEFAADAQAARPLKIGDRAPDFTVRKADGSAYAFMSHDLQRPYVIIFYRGGWCPYCNAQLADLHTVEPRLKSSGFEVLFLSTDRPELLYTSLKVENQTLPYTLLSDNELRAAQAFHIAYHLDDKAFAEQLKWGVNLEQTTGTTRHALPVPSVFIVDRSGVIQYVYSNPDFRVRLHADALWQAATRFAPSAQQR